MFMTQEQSHQSLLSQPEKEPGGKQRDETASDLIAYFTCSFLRLCRMPGFTSDWLLYASVHMIK